MARESKKTTAVGSANRNRQTVVAPTGKAGTDHGQYVYVLRCGDCAHEYGANGEAISGSAGVRVPRRKARPTLLSTPLDPANGFSVGSRL